MTHSYLGALHIHSTCSDGTGSIEHIIKQAVKAKLKWIIITDHNNLDAQKYEGFYNGVCVLSGCEITPRRGNHLLAFGINKAIDPNIAPVQYIDEVHKQNGFCFPAHPDENIHRENKQPPLRWEDWTINTFDGLEIWNYLTDWTDLYSLNKNKYIQYLMRHQIVKGPSKNVLTWWDRLNNAKDKIVPGIAGIDAHAFKFKETIFGTATISDYFDFFNTIGNMIWLDKELSNNFKEAKKQIFSALKNGNNIIVNRKITRDTNINFYLSNKNNCFYAGESAVVDKYAKIKVQLPLKAQIRLLHNGVLVFENETKILEFDNPAIGNYRIEVYYNNRPWIFSNPIKISGE